MKFRKKISFYIIALKILLVPIVRSFPQTFSRNSCIKNKKLPLLLSADIFPVTDTNDDIWNLEPEYKTFNYPEVKCPLTSKSKHDLLETNTRTPFQRKSRSKYLPKYDNLKRLKTDSGKIDSSLPSIFSSDPNYRDIANFPEVEYPLKASEIWKPNFWNNPTDFSYRNVNANNYCIKPTLNECFKPVKNYERKIEPRPRIISTKSAANAKKNLISLNKQKNYTTASVNEIKKNNNTVFLNSSYVDTYHEIVNPISVSPCSQGNKSKDEYNNDVCPIDSKVLDIPSEKFFKSGIASNSTAQSKLLISEYAKKFKDEMKSILQSVVDDIILNNFEFAKENVMPPTQMIKKEDILKSTSRIDDLNIYNEFASPDLLKNRRSQSFNEFTQNCDSFLSNINLKPQQVTSVDNLLTTNTRKCKEDYLANEIENSNDILKTNTYDYENLRKEIDCHRLEPKNTQLIADGHKTQLSMADVMVERQVDKLNDDMTCKLKTKVENIFLKPHEDYKDNHGQPLCAGNNDIFYYIPKSRSNDCLNKNNKEMFTLKPSSENAINDFHYSTKLTDEAINKHVDNLHNDMTRKMTSKANNFLFKPYDYCHGETIGAQLSISDESDNHNYLKPNSISTEIPVLKDIPENIRKDYHYLPILTDTSTKICVDKLHNEAISMSKSKTDTVFSKPFESSYNQIRENKSDNDNLNCYSKLELSNKYITNEEVIPEPKLDDIIKICDLYDSKLKDDNRQSQYKNSQQQTDLSNKCIPTQAPQFSDILSKTNNNDDKSNVQQEFSKTPTTCDNLLPSKNKTSGDEALLTCVSDGNDINKNDKEDSMFLPENDKEAECGDSVDKEIEIDEDFTTDSYLEDEGWSSYALSTVAPRTSTVDTLWRDTSVIEPDKSLSYPDELEQYFLLN